MSKEILLLVESISNERGIDQELVFDAVEEALATVAAKNDELDVAMRVSIDRTTGDYDTFRVWSVVPDDIEALCEAEEARLGDNLEAEREWELRSDQQILLTEAKEVDSELGLGDVIEEPVESLPLGRIAAQQAKQVILQKVRQAEREKIMQNYEKRLNEMVTGVVKRVSRDAIVLDLGSNAEALLARDDMIPREAFRINDRVRAYLYATREERRGPQLAVSRTKPEFLIELFKIEVPEIGEEVIEVRAAARDVGSRAKIAVKTNDGRIDPIGACVGMRGSRVQAVSNELGGERIDIVLWDDNPAQMVINAMAPAEVLSIVADEETQSMDIAVAEEQLSQAIGRGGQNVRLASELSGWALNVMSETAAEEKQNSEQTKARQVFVDGLDVDEDLADALVQEGYASLEEVAYVDPAELLQMVSLDEEMVEELQRRASDMLLAQEIEKEGMGGEPAEDLLALDGMTTELADNLAVHGILTREDLAEQAVDDLLDLGLDAEFAGKLIMVARAHWFE